MSMNRLEGNLSIAKAKPNALRCLLVAMQFTAPKICSNKESLVRV